MSPMTAVVEKDIMKRIPKCGECRIFGFEYDGQNGWPNHDLRGFSELIMDPCRMAKQRRNPAAVSGLCASLTDIADLRGRGLALLRWWTDTGSSRALKATYQGGYQAGDGSSLGITYHMIHCEKQQSLRSKGYERVTLAHNTFLPQKAAGVKRDRI